MSEHHALLDDAGMRDFIVNGYVVVNADFPNDVHESIFRQTEAVFENEGNPGNNILPRVPQLQSVLDHPRVHGALSSILGPEYYVHPCRHCHFNSPGSSGQQMHRDNWTRCRSFTRGRALRGSGKDAERQRGREESGQLFPRPHNYSGPPRFRPVALPPASAGRLDPVWT